MKKQTAIVIILCVLVAAVIALNVLGGVGSKDSFAGYTGVPTVSLPNAEDMNPYYGSRTFP